MSKQWGELEHLRRVVVAIEELAEKLAAVPEHRSMSARIWEALTVEGGADE